MRFAPCDAGEKQEIHKMKWRVVQFVILISGACGNVFKAQYREASLVWRRAAFQIYLPMHYKH
jgi:hypothetical protein